MRELGLCLEDLAARCEWNVDALRSERSAGFPCKYLRWRIEAVCDYCAIWSSPVEVELRRKCFRAYDLDPRLALLPEIEKLCRKLGVQRPSVRRQEKWQEALLAYLAVNCPITTNESKAKS